MVQNRIAEIRADLPADLDLVVDRQTPAVFPIYALNLTGRSTAGGPLRLRLLRHPAGALARARRGPRRRPGERHARGRGHRRSRARCSPRKLTVDDVAASLTWREPLEPVGHYPDNGLQRLRARRPACGNRVADIAATPVVITAGADACAPATSAPCAWARRTGCRSSPARAATRPPSACRSRSAPISSRFVKASRTALERAEERASGRPHADEDLRPRRVRRRAPSPTCAMPS